MISVCFWTAIQGAWILADAAVLKGFSMPGILIFPVCFVAGLLLQLLTSRRQQLFKKVRPDVVTHWMEKRGLL